MEDQVIERTLEKLRNSCPSANVSLVESKIGPDFWSFEIDDGLVSGSGASINAQIAFNKALSEFVERHAVKTYAKQLGAKTSSGFAAHFDEASANDAAIGELIERDAFLACWFSGISPVWVELDKLSFDRKISDLLSTLLSYEIDVKLGFLAKSGAYIVAAGMISFLRYTNQKVAYGFATEADTSVIGALQKVALSLFRIANLIMTRKSQNVALFEYTEADKIRHPFQHLEYYLNPANSKLIEYFWQSSSQEILEIEQPKLQVQLLSLPLADIMDRKVSLASSDELLHYFCGKKVEINSVKNRLSALGLELRQNTEILHPLS